jgi:hypothetical protein
MTDQEKAIALGNYIIKLQRDVDALQGVFTEYRIQTPEGRCEIPWREQARRIALEEGPQQIAAEQRRVLLQALSGETQGSVLIRELYRQFLEE